MVQPHNLNLDTNRWSRSDYVHILCSLWSSQVQRKRIPTLNFTSISSCFSCTVSSTTITTQSFMMLPTQTFIKYKSNFLISYQKFYHSTLFIELIITHTFHLFMINDDWIIKLNMVEISWTESAFMIKKRQKVSLTRVQWHTESADWGTRCLFVGRESSVWWC